MTTAESDDGSTQRDAAAMAGRLARAGNSRLHGGGAQLACPARRASDPCMTDSRAPAHDAQSRRSALMAAAQAGDAAPMRRCCANACPSCAVAAVRRAGRPGRRRRAGRAADHPQGARRPMIRAGRSTPGCASSPSGGPSISCAGRAGRAAARSMRRRRFDNSVDDDRRSRPRLEQADAAGRVGRRASRALPTRQREAVHHWFSRSSRSPTPRSRPAAATGSLKVNLHRALKALRAQARRGELSHATPIR